MASYRAPVLIYNPAAGKLRRDPAGIIQRSIAALRDAGIAARPVPTTGPGTAGELAKKCILEGADLIIAAGGDGTINEVANGMVYSQVPLGILPGGTANCLAIELGFGKQLNRAIDRLTECAEERIAVGRLSNALGERYFLLMAGAGLDAQIVYTVQAGLKSLTGKVAYWIGGASALTRPLAEFETQIGMRRMRTGFALASRVKNYGGDLSIATGASLLEDDFEVVLFEGRNPVRYWGYFLGVVTRTLPKFPGITVERTRRLTFRSPEDRRTYIQVDGEYAGHLPATVEIVDEAITLLVPADFRERVKVTAAMVPAAG